jgi:hypothetical protein
LLFYKPS